MSIKVNISADTSSFDEKLKKTQEEIKKTKEVVEKSIDIHKEKKGEKDEKNSIVFSGYHNDGRLRNGLGRMYQQARRRYVGKACDGYDGCENCLGERAFG